MLKFIGIVVLVFWVWFYWQEKKYAKAQRESMILSNSNLQVASWPENNPTPNSWLADKKDDEVKFIIFKSVMVRWEAIDFFSIEEYVTPTTETGWFVQMWMKEGELYEEKYFSWSEAITRLGKLQLVIG